MQKSLGYLVFTISIIVFGTACSETQSPEANGQDSYSSTFDSLTTAYQDSLKAQHGGLTADFLHTWGDRYWKLVKANPDHKRAPEVARQAF